MCYYYINMGNEKLNLTTGVSFGMDAREKLHAGMKIAAEAVGCTLGPRGRCVLIQKGDGVPIVTKDGVTVARSIRLKDSISAMGASLIHEAASRTNEVAGDGTTTSTILTYAMVSEGLKLMSSGHDPILIKKGIEESTKFVIEYLKSCASPIKSYDDVKHVATISANGDVNVGDIIAQAMEKVGQDGIITVEDAKGMSTTLEVVEGMQLDRGYVSPYFVTNQDKMQTIYHDAYILVTDKKISSLQDILPILEFIQRERAGLLIIAEDIEGDALQGLVLNKTKSNLNVVAIRAPGYGRLKDQLLSDISVLTSAKLVSSQTGVLLSKSDKSILGRCKKIVVDARNTTIVGNGSSAEAVEIRINELRTQSQDITIDAAEMAHIKTRIARLSSGVAVIKVGGSTELEMIERKYRIEDALHATRAASEEGIVPGGGTALFEASIILQQEIMKKSITEAAGYNVVLAGCLAPIKTITKNAGTSYEVVIDKLLQRRVLNDIPYAGYDAAKGEIVDMVKTGVIDPVKVTRVALENAASVAITFLTLDAVVYEE